MQLSRTAFHARPLPVFALVLALGALALACGGQSAQDHLAAARASLASSDYAAATGAADAGLAANPDEVTAWGLELVKLEALSRSGDGAGTVAQLTQLADANAARITAADYSGTAQLLRTAGQKAEAIQVLDLGFKRFPDDAVIKKMLDDSVEAGADVDPAELEMLRSLGYID